MEFSASELEIPGFFDSFSIWPRRGRSIAPCGGDSGSLTARSLERRDNLIGFPGILEAHALERDVGLEGMKTVELWN